jgi:hypothetical protein
MISATTATSAALLHERDALLDRVLYLGGIVEAVCVELGIHHDTTADEVVAAIRAVRGAA